MQVGQLLTNLRVSSNNLLLPFTAQMLQLLQDSPVAQPAPSAGEAVMTTAFVTSPKAASLTGVGHAAGAAGGAARAAPARDAGPGFRGLKVQAAMLITVLCAQEYIRKCATTVAAWGLCTCELNL